MGRRQEQLDSMRQRITEAAFELHAIVGPAQTSISAIAERAGVQRHTVYHHFPDMTSLMQACTAHGMRTTGIPDAASWVAIEDPIARLRHGLGELYAYDAANARLLGNVVRDLPLMADIGGAEEFADHMTGLFYALAAGWVDTPETQRLRMAAIGHASPARARWSLATEASNRVSSPVAWLWMSSNSTWPEMVRCMIALMICPARTSQAPL